MGSVFSSILFIAVLFIAMILYYRAKNNWNDAHPKVCSICGEKSSQTAALKDGIICYKCSCAPYGGRDIHLMTLMNKMQLKMTSVEEMKDYIATIKQRGQLVKSFNSTRTSPSGMIKVDDNLGLFTINGNSSDRFAHRISDITSFKLVIDKDYSDSSDVALIEGGHIEIGLREPIRQITMTMGVEDKLVGMKHEVKKTFEGELSFLEEVTGKKRR